MKTAWVRVAVGWVAMWTLGCDNTLTSDGPQEENTSAACSDGVDNDGDNFFDCYDSDCAAIAVCAEAAPGRAISGPLPRCWVRSQPPPAVSAAARATVVRMRFMQESFFPDARGVSPVPSL